MSFLPRAIFLLTELALMFYHCPQNQYCGAGSVARDGGAGESGHPLTNFQARLWRAVSNRRYDGLALSEAEGSLP